MKTRRKPVPCRRPGASGRISRALRVVSPQPVDDEPGEDEWENGEQRNEDREEDRGRPPVGFVAPPLPVAPPLLVAPPLPDAVLTHWFRSVAQEGRLERRIFSKAAESRNGRLATHGRAGRDLHRDRRVPVSGRLGAVDRGRMRDWERGTTHAAFCVGFRP